MPFDANDCSFHRGNSEKGWKYYRQNRTYESVIAMHPLRYNYIEGVGCIYLDSSLVLVMAFDFIVSLIHGLPPPFAFDAFDDIADQCQIDQVFDLADCLMVRLALGVGGIWMLIGVVFLCQLFRLLFCQSMLLLNGFILGGTGMDQHAPGKVAHGDVSISGGAAPCAS